MMISDNLQFLFKSVRINSGFPERVCRWSLLTVFFIMFLHQGSYAQELEVKEDFFFIDGKKTFIKGVGYAIGEHPGEVPWDYQFDEDVLRHDIERILSAGFNTIRTWGEFKEEELEVLSEYDIHIIMGIWIDPHGDFSNPGFVENAVSIINEVLDYSQYHDNIIAYLIMNEPLPETIFNAGYEESVSLWQTLKNIINTRHPNRPVSIANTCNGTFISPELFDFSAFNLYIYNPVTISYLHQYHEYVSYLKTLSSQQQPLVVTEFGLSVSPSGPGNWGYGGNSLSEQSEGLMHMYQSLVNGGASGCCVFNYSDGWWKGGDENSHDDQTEEWFGLVAYENLNDQYGLTRPAWDSVKKYQSAIISKPVSGEIYSGTIPLEFFPESRVSDVLVLSGDSVLFETSLEDSWFSDSLTVYYSGMIDMTLEFRFLDAESNIVKKESRTVLMVEQEPQLPDIQIQVNEDLWESGDMVVDYQITKSSDFSVSEDMDIAFYPHIGFQYGLAQQVTMPSSDPFTIQKTYSIPSDAEVITLGAAFDISFGEFKKRIVNQSTFTKEETSINSFDELSKKNQHISIVPNPVKESFLVVCDNENQDGFSFELLNTAGIIVSCGDYIRGKRISVKNIPGGLYFLKLKAGSGTDHYTAKVVVM